MSNGPLSREARFACFNDCRQEGCPGHTLQLRSEKHSDCITVIVDGKDSTGFDSNEFDELLKLGEKPEWN